MAVTALTRDQIAERLHEAESEIRSLGVKRLSLFGSVLHGRARPDSDIDLLVELSPRWSSGTVASARMPAPSVRFRRHRTTNTTT